MWEGNIPIFFSKRVFCLLLHNCSLDTVHYFMNKLGMKPCLHVPSGNKHFFTKWHQRQTYQNYEQPSLGLTFSNISKFWLLKIGQIFSNKFFFEEYWTRRPTFIKKYFWKSWFLKKLWFLKMCPILTLFTEKMLISIRWIHGFMPNLIKKSYGIYCSCYPIVKVPNCPTYFEWHLPGLDRGACSSLKSFAKKVVVESSLL